MCKMAETNKEAIVSPHSNCHYEYKPGMLLSCKEKNMLFTAQKFTWSQIERPLSAEDFCADDFTYGVLMREPLSLMTTFVNAENVDVETMLDYLSNPKAFHSHGIRHTPTHYQFFDNYMTRALNGGDAYKLPPTALTDEHLEIAKQRLRRDFDLVVLTETISRDQDQLKARLGWRNVDVDALHAELEKERKLFTWETGKMLPHLHRFKELGANYAQRLVYINKYDVELYNYANDLAAERTEHAANSLTQEEDFGGGDAPMAAMVLG